VTLRVSRPQKIPSVCRSATPALRGV